jgi:hypothetical protein
MSYACEFTEFQETPCIVHKGTVPLNTSPGRTRCLPPRPQVQTLKGHAVQQRQAVQSTWRRSGDSPRSVPRHA